jgi:hypothetical protein
VPERQLPPALRRRQPVPPAAEAGTASLVSIRTTTAPSEILSPSFTFTSLTTPATLLGTSIVALSDSRVTKASSSLMVSPTATQTSMTGTSW